MKFFPNRLRNNIEYLLKKFTNKCDIYFVIKSNCYNIGYENVLPILAEYQQKNLCCFFPEEIYSIKKYFNYKFDLIILEGYDNRKKNLFLDYENLIPAICSYEQLNNWKNDFSDRKYWLHIDTGLNRNGIDYREFKEENFINDNQLEYIITHLSESKGEYLDRQFMNFQNATNKLKCKKSFLKSCEFDDHTDKWLDGIRIGHALYFNINRDNQLQDVIDIYGNLQQIKLAQKNDYIGYRRQYQLNKDLYIGILNIGYANNIPLNSINKCYVIINNIKYLIIGSLSMNHITILLNNNEYNVKINDIAYFSNINYPLKNQAEILNISIASVIK